MSWSFRFIGRGDKVAEDVVKYGESVDKAYLNTSERPLFAGQVEAAATFARDANGAHVYVAGTGSGDTIHCESKAEFHKSTAL